MTVAAALAALALGSLHLVAGRLRFLDAIPRSRWLSFGSGVSVAYVCMHVLPELAAHQRRLAGTELPGLGLLEHHVYFFALLGLSVFYGLERLVTRSRLHSRRAHGVDIAGPGVFWIHVGSFAGYNALIGYLLLHRETPGVRGLTLFALAMGAHFVVNDYGLRHDHRHRYHDIGRWILAVAVLIGWSIGATTRIHRTALAIFFAFLAGGVLLNVLKEELPRERESAFWAFALGAAAYTALLRIL